MGFLQDPLGTVQNVAEKVDASASKVDDFFKDPSGTFDYYLDTDDWWKDVRSASDYYFDTSDWGHGVSDTWVRNRGWIVPTAAAAAGFFLGGPMGGLMGAQLGMGAMGLGQQPQVAQAQYPMPQQVESGGTGSGLLYAGTPAQTGNGSNVMRAPLGYQGNMAEYQTGRGLIRV